jgi:hypothetical protein
MQDQRSADAKTYNGGERDHLQCSPSHLENIGGKRHHCAQKAYDIEPKGRSNLREVLPEPQLK